MTVTILGFLCLAVSAACAFLLLRAWSQNRLRLLLFSGLGFSGIALNNFLVMIDSRIAADLSSWRAIPTLIGLAVMIWGLIGETHQ